MAINETEELTLEHQELDMQNVERSAVYLEVSPVNTNNGLTFESQKPVNMQQGSIAASRNVVIASNRILLLILQDVHEIKEDNKSAGAQWQSLTEDTVSYHP